VTEAQLPTYQDALDEVSQGLAEHGNQNLVTLDAVPLLGIEDEYGIDAFEQVRERVLQLLIEQRGRDYRVHDKLVVEDPRSVRFILFMERKRRRNLAPTVADLQLIRSRIVASLVPAMVRAAFPYLKSTAGFEVGYGVALHNPLVHPDRSLRRAIDESRELAAHHRRAEEIHVRERLQELILRERVGTAYQPIMGMEDRVILGYEALSRGPRGSGLEGADALFGGAEAHGLMVELDRLCRQQALLNSSRLPLHARIFVNTLPATIRDPQFRGRALIDFLQRANVSPNRIVIEITEKLVIDNYSLFREAMDYFIALGINFAVDDVGSGYSGLEAIAKLKPAFLKIDMGLVRDVHISVANREIIKAILALGHGMGAGVIAEGIQTEDEMACLLDMGIDYGQVFLLARPDPGPDPLPV
jgi:EAL domain-containing protein (putative c-di-GMP-specific phosphodiesterase class I)